MITYCVPEAVVPLIMVLQSTLNSNKSNVGMEVPEGAECLVVPLGLLTGADKVRRVWVMGVRWERHREDLKWRVLGAGGRGDGCMRLLWFL